MKLLVADFLFVDAHKHMNINFIKAINRFADCDVVSANGYYDAQIESFWRDNIDIIEINAVAKSGSIGSRRFSLELMKKTADIVRKRKYDAIICLGFETTIFGIRLFDFHNIPIFLFHHKNIDELTNKVKRIAFCCYKDRVNHVVFEEFFRDRLVQDIKIPPQKVFVVPHPAESVANAETNINLDCIGLCNSNDEGFIQEAIRRDQEFLKHNLHILLRSKLIEKKGGAVEVIKGYMEKGTYDRYLAAGNSVLIALPESYIYRLSGSVYDALSRGKVVYINSKYYAQEYERRYPGTCKYVNSVEQLIEELQERKCKKVIGSFQKFLNEHSIETVSRKIECIVKFVLKESPIS